MDYSLKEVAGRIKDLREAKGYTQEELAKLTGVSVEEYRVLEQGDTDFSFTFIYKCAKACDVEVVDLLDGTSSTLSSFSITRQTACCPSFSCFSVHNLFSNLLVSNKT